MPRLLRYAWALFPGTLLGLLCVPLALFGGGRCRVVRGCVEVHGGAVTWLLRHGLPWIGGGAAMTLGHVIIGQNEKCLDRSRDHEHVHVRQYERWGPLFVPAYLAASIWAWSRGRSAYLDNPFEREAFERTDRPRG
ncbi:MAG TPA: hypothetical protein VF170_00830 [Planctomycetaceae bacterium]